MDSFPKKSIILILLESCLIKICGINLHDWQKYSSTEYVRNQDGKLFGPVSIIKIYSRYGLGHAWYPEFSDQLDFIQKIYDESTNYKEFDWDRQEEGMDFIDDFLRRLDKIKAFL